MSAPAYADALATVSEAVTVTAPAYADALATISGSQFSIVDYPSKVSGTQSSSKTVNVVIQNIGDTDGECTVRIKDHNGTVVAEQTQTITAGGSATYSLQITLPSETGTYTWTIEAYNVDNASVDDTKSFTVEVTTAPTKKKGVSPWVWLILIFVGVAVAWKWQEQKQEQQPSS